MKLYRFMSMKEFNKLSLGLTLVHKTAGTHNFYARTSSKGFCFLPENVEFDYAVGGSFDEYDQCVIKAEDCTCFLTGIIDDDILVEFECENIGIMKKSYGIYANPFSDEWDDYIEIEEYSIPVYSNEILIPTRYSMCDGKWYNFN